MSKKQFDILKACFWLLSAIVIAVMSMLFVTMMGCVYGVGMKVIEPGTCTKSGLLETIHSWWQELLTAILALIIAGTGGKPPPPTDEGTK